jgi:hypothetical protein
MFKKAVALPVALVVVLLASGVSFAYVLSRQNADNLAETPVPTTTQSGGVSSEAAAGRKIDIPKWNVTFQLPADIAVTEIRTTKDTSVTTDALIIGSSVVATSYDRQKCSGTNVTFGEIFSIFRFDAAKDGAKKVGNSYYKVVEPLAETSCYDSATLEKYFAADVRQTAERTLETTQ